MARVWEDQPDYYVTADLDKVWTSVSTGTSGLVSVASGGRRSGANCIKIEPPQPAAFNLSYGITKTLAPSGATIICSFGLHVESLAVVGANYGRAIWSVGDATVWHVSLALNSDGTLGVYNGRNWGARTGGTLLGTTSGSVPVGSYIHVSVKIAIHNSTGTVSVKFDGVEQLGGGSGLSSQDTQNGGTTAWTRFGFATEGVSSADKGPRFRVCDIVVSDASGAANNDHPGNASVYVNLPDANGGVRDFTPSTGSDDFAVVDETSPNDATDYLESSGSGDRVTLGFPDLATASGDVRWVTFRNRLALSAAGAEQAVGVVRVGSTNYDGSVNLAPSTSYAYKDDCRETDPSTAATWTLSGVNAAEGGLKRST